MKNVNSRGPANEPAVEQRPSSARMYDYLLGGYHNFEADRAVARNFIEILPSAPLMMKTNRGFLRRIVNYLLDQGVDQFLDLGSGIPTVGNVHEITHKHNPLAHVVYVDIDPVAVRQSEEILKDTPTAAVVQADMRQPKAILEHTETQRLLDFDRPMAVLITSVLLFLPEDEEAFSVVATVREALSAGSYICISHGTPEGSTPQTVEQSQKLYAASGNPMKLRLRAEIEQFFEGLELISPGLVYLPQWRPECPDDLFTDEPEASGMFGALGRKP